MTTRTVKKTNKHAKQTLLFCESCFPHLALFSSLWCIDNKALLIMSSSLVFD